MKECLSLRGIYDKNFQFIYRLNFDFNLINKIGKKINI